MISPRNLVPYIFPHATLVTISGTMLRPKHLHPLLVFLLFAGVAVAAAAAEDEKNNTDFLLNVFSDVGP
jgi:hypothetical protein